METHKVMVFGSHASGKTCLLIKFDTGNFMEGFDHTIDDDYRKTIKIDKSSCLIQGIDTVGNDQFTAVRDFYMKDGHGFLLVYSITDRSSFEAVRTIHAEIAAMRQVERFPAVIVGNRSDLEDQRQVSREEGQELARSLGCPFFEASSKTPQNVDEVFIEVVREIRKEKASEGLEGGKKEKCCLM